MRYVSGPTLDPYRGRTYCKVARCARLPLLEPFCYFAHLLMSSCFLTQLRTQNQAIQALVSESVLFPICG
jgi:hypothetical protein